MTSKRYAQGTEVPVGRSRDEIEHTLERFGATGQVWMRDDEKERVTVGFKRLQRAYKFTVHLPPLKEFRLTPSGKWSRTEQQMVQARDAEVRRRFRSLANYVKALLDAIDTGIVTADEALLPYLLLPSGETVYQRAERQLESQGDVNLAKALMSGEE